jgi:hypothetical protein
MLTIGRAAAVAANEQFVSIPVGLDHQIKRRGQVLLAGL